MHSSVAYALPLWGAMIRRLSRVVVAGTFLLAGACGGTEGSSSAGPDATGSADGTMPDGVVEVGPIEVVVSGWPDRAAVQVLRLEDLPILVSPPSTANTRCC